MNQSVNSPGHASIGRESGNGKVWIVNEANLRTSAYLKNQPFCNLSLISDFHDVIANAYRHTAIPEIIEPVDDSERVSPRALITQARLKTRHGAINQT